MSSPPIDTSGIDEPLPDLSHEAIRTAVLSAINTVWTEHQNLVTQVNDQATQIADLTTRVTALETPPLP